MATFFRFLHGNLLENTSTLARQQQSETTTTNFPFFSRSKHFLSKTNHNFKRCNQNGNVFTLLERKCAYCFPNNEMEWARMSTQKKIVADKLVYHKQRWLIRICRNYRRKIYSQEPLSKRWVNGEIISICFVRQEKSILQNSLIRIIFTVCCCYWMQAPFRLRSRCIRFTFFQSIWVNHTYFLLQSNNFNAFYFVWYFSLISFFRSIFFSSLFYSLALSV